MRVSSRARGLERCMIWSAAGQERAQRLRPLRPEIMAAPIPFLCKAEGAPPAPDIVAFLCLVSGRRHRLAGVQTIKSGALALGHLHAGGETCRAERMDEQS